MVEHVWSHVYFKKPTWCSFCKEFIVGVLKKQGHKCKVCRATVHPNCRLASPNCPGKKYYSTPHDEDGGPPPPKFIPSPPPPEALHTSPLGPPPPSFPPPAGPPPSGPPPNSHPPSNRSVSAAVMSVGPPLNSNPPLPHRIRSSSESTLPYHPTESPPPPSFPPTGPPPPYGHPPSGPPPPSVYPPSGPPPPSAHPPSGPPPTKNASHVRAASHTTPSNLGPPPPFLPPSGPPPPFLPPSGPPPPLVHPPSGPPPPLVHPPSGPPPPLAHPPSGPPPPLVHPPSGPPPTKNASHVRAASHTTPSNLAPPLPPRATSFVVSQPFPSKKLAKALWDFAAENPGELELKAGDEIEIKKIEGIWWFGLLPNGKSGYFPGNFVEKIGVWEL